MSSNDPAALTPMQKYERLALAVRSRRSWLGMTQLDVHARGGPSNSTLTQIESAREPLPTQATMRKLDRGLQWPEGTARMLLERNASVEEIEEKIHAEPVAPMRGVSVIAGQGTRPETPELTGATLANLYGQVVVFAESIRKLDWELANGAIELMMSAGVLYGEALAVIEGRKVPEPHPSAEEVQAQVARLHAEYDAATAARGLSEAPYRTGDLIAADHQESSISGEQEESDTP